MYLVFLLLLFVVGGKGAATPINDCGSISSPGFYILTANLDPSGGNCLYITANGVDIDGNGKKITTGNPAIRLNSGNSNVIIHGIAIENAQLGFEIENANGIILDNIQMKNFANMSAAIVITGSINVTVRNSNFDGFLDVNKIIAIEGLSNTVHVKNNEFKNILVAHETALIQAVNSANVEFESNTVTNVYYECSSYYWTYNYNAIFYAYDASVTMVGNIITNVYDDTGNCYVKFQPISYPYMNARIANITNNLVSGINFIGTPRRVDLVLLSYMPSCIIYYIGNRFTNITMASGTLGTLNCADPTAVLVMEDNVISDMHLAPAFTNYDAGYIACIVDSVRNNDFPSSIVFSGFIGHCMLDNTVLFKNLCFPPSNGTCCLNCKYNGLCATTYTSDYYIQGSCSSPAQTTCSNPSTNVNVYLAELSDTIVSVGAYVYLSGPGLDIYFPSMAVFGGPGQQLNHSWFGSGSPYRLELGQDEHVYDVSVSLDGVYSASQPTLRLITIDYSPNLQLYSTANTILAYWEPYIGTHHLLAYNVTFKDSLGGYLTQLVQTTAVTWGYPVMSGRSYFIEAFPVFDFGAGLKFSSNYDYYKGPLDISVGSAGNETFSKMVYDQFLHVYYLIGTTTGSLNGSTHLGYRDIFVSTITPNGTLSFFAQGGTAGDDELIDAVAGTDGTLYVLTCANGGSSYYIGTYTAAGQQPGFTQILNYAGGASYYPVSIVEVYGGKLWVLGSTNGVFNDGPPSQEYSAFYAQYSMPFLNFQLYNLWHVSVNEKVTGHTYSYGNGRLFVLGYTTGANSGHVLNFITQFDTSINSPKPHTLVFSKVYDSFTSFIDPANPPKHIALSSTRQMLAVASLNEVYTLNINSNYGFIADYVGCFSFPPTPVATFTTNAFPAECRAQCSGQSTFAFINSTHCVCSNTALDPSDSDSLACDNPCPYSELEKCGSTSAQLWYSVFTSANTVQYMDFSGFVSTDILSISFVPSSANQFLLVGKDYTVRASKATDGQSAIYAQETPLAGAYVFPDLTTVLFGKALSTTYIPVLSVNGPEDAYVSFIYPSTEYVSGPMKLAFSDFTAMTIYWGRPMEIPDDWAVTYKLHQIDRLNNTDNVIYNGYDQTYVFTNSSGFEHFYYLESFFEGHSTTNHFIYAAKAFQFGFSNNESPAIVRYDENNGDFVIVYNYKLPEEDDTQTIAMRVDPVTGHFDVINTYYSPYSINDFIILTNGNVMVVAQSVAEASPLLITPTAAHTYDGSELSDRQVFAASLGFQGKFYFVGLRDNGEGTNPFLSSYSAAGVYNSSIVFTDVSTAGNSDDFVVRAHPSKPLVYLAVSSKNIVGPSHVFIVNTDDNTSTTVQLPDNYALPFDGAIDTETGEFYIVCSYRDFNTFYMIYVLDPTNGNSITNISPEQDVNFPLPIVLAQTYGKGFWRSSTFRDADRLSWNLYLIYNDLVGPDFYGQQLPIISYNPNVGNNLDITSMAYGNVMIAVAGRSGGVDLGFNFDGQQHFVVFTSEIPNSATFTYKNQQATSISFEWGKPQGVQIANTASVYYSIRMTYPQGNSAIVYNGTGLECIIPGLTPISKYDFLLTAYFGNPLRSIVYNSTRAATLSDNAVYSNYAVPYPGGGGKIHTAYAGDKIYVFTYFAGEGKKRSLPDMDSGMFNMLLVYDSYSPVLNQQSNVTFENVDLPSVYDLTVDNKGTVYFVGRTRASSVGFVCSIETAQIIGEAVPTCFNYTDPGANSTYPIEFLSAIPVGSSLWVLGQAYGILQGQTNFGYSDAFVGVITAPGTITYKQFGTEEDDVIRHALLHPTLPLVYLLIGTFSGQFYVSVLDTNTRDVLQIYKWGVESRGGTNANCVFNSIAFDEDNQKLTALAEANSINTCIIDLQLNSSGLVVSNSNATILLDTIIKSLVYIPGTGGRKIIAGQVNKNWHQPPIDGYQYTGDQDYYFGVGGKEDSYVQYGSTGRSSNLAAVYLNPVQKNLIFVGYSTSFAMYVDMRSELLPAAPTPPSQVWASPFSMKVSWPSIEGKFDMQILHSGDFMTFATSGTEAVLGSIWNFDANSAETFRAIGYSPIFGAVYSTNATLYTAAWPTLSFFPSETEIEVEWSGVVGLGFNSYHLTMLQPGNSSYDEVTLMNTESGSFTVTGLIVDSIYTFRMHAYDETAEGTTSSSQDITTNSVPVLSPTPPNVMYISHYYVGLVWTISYADTTYTLQQYTESGVKDLRHTAGTVEGLQPATEYTFRMKVNANAFPATFYYSTNLTLITLALPSLTIDTVRATSANVNWLNADNPFGRQAYSLQYSNGSSYTDVIQLPSANGNHIASGLTPNASYSFRIEIHDTTNSSYKYLSSAVNFTTLDGTTPTAPYATWVSHHSASITWETLLPGTFYLQQFVGGKYVDVPTSNNSAIVRGLTPATYYTFQVVLNYNSANFTSPNVTFKTLHLPAFSFLGALNTTNIRLVADNIYSSMTYTLEFSRNGASFVTVLDNVKQGDKIVVTNLRPNTTYPFRYKIVDNEGVVDYTPNNTITTPSDPYVQQAIYGSSGNDQVYSSAVDPSTGNVYTMGFTYDSSIPAENGNFILRTKPTNEVINYIPYGVVNQVVTASIVDNAGTLRFVGPDTANTKGFALFGLSGTGSVNSVTYKSIGAGTDIASNLFQDPTGALWIVGNTNGSFVTAPNAGRKDAFAIIINANTNYVQWGTGGDDVPLCFAINSQHKKVYVAGYTTGNFGDNSYTGTTSFITEFNYDATNSEPITTQLNIAGGIEAISYDPATSSLTLIGNEGRTRTRAPGGNFVATIIVSASGQLLPSTLTIASFGDSGDTIVAYTFIPSQAIAVAVGYRSTADYGIDGVYYRIVAGVSEAAVQFGSYYDDIPASIVNNGGSVQIFGTLFSGATPVDVFMYSLLAGSPVTIPAPFPPAFGDITTTSISVLWVAPFASTYTYTLEMYNRTTSNHNPLFSGPPHAYLVTGLTPNTTYTFVLKINGTNVLYSSLVDVKTAGEKCADLSCSCATNQIRCTNGTCVDSLSQCLVVAKVCPPETPYLCANQTCAASYIHCSAGVGTCNNKTVCWNGACVDSPTACTNVPSCPVFTRRCPDGTCLNPNVTCANNTCNATALCEDGSCPPCLSAYGCPIKTPILCPNGHCVLNGTSCQFNCTNGTFMCYDGTCKANYSSCITPPRLKHAASFTYFLPHQNTTNRNKSLTVEILSTGLEPIATVTLPYALFPLANNLMLDITPVSDTVLINTNGTGIWANESYSTSLVSTVLSLVFPGYNISKFISQVSLSFNNTLPPNTNISHLCMAFINQTTRQWQCESNVEIINGTIVGKTSHFTEFAVLLGKVKAPEVNTIDPDDFKNLGKINKNTVGVYVLSGIVFFYLVGLFFTIRIDKKNARFSLHYAAMNSSRSTIQLSDISKSESSPTLSFSPSMGDSAPSSPTLSSSPSSPNYRTSMLIADKEGVKDEKGARVGFRALIMARLRIKHSWVAVTASPPTAPHTRTAMLTLLLCMVLGNLLISAAFYQNSDDTGIAQRIITGIICAVIVFPMTLILSLMFKRTPQKYWYIPFVIAFAFCTVAIVLILVYTLKFGDTKSRAWLVSISIATGQDGIINQPIKLLLTSLVIMLFPASWFTPLLM